jgi:hypothetical protein
LGFYVLRDILAERKRLKKLGKAQVEKQSRELQEKLKESNPVDISDPQWTKNYKEITLREKRYKQNRTEVYPGRFIGKEILLDPVAIDWSRGYVPINGYYLCCNDCKDLLPMNPEIDLTCSCGSVSLLSSSGEVDLVPDKVTVTKLIAKASAKRRWEFWK